ncbi:hypothetical protein GCM10011415_42540 [Salipiger pallidus]|uniref:DUF4375 domain-containing protein n=1 Tax=Salipiger pallidus TaxID=1775170 RepID=A0A8J2ZP13_9RHOB|nr:hypothetical protein [Salipiger pallidus]GGG87467.1 hypothetical protein GCM10011415_42540 [Salipiger pallidus]
MLTRAAAEIEAGRVTIDRATAGSPRMRMARPDVEPRCFALYDWLSERGVFADPRSLSRVEYVCHGGVLLYGVISEDGLDSGLGNLDSPAREDALPALTEAFLAYQEEAGETEDGATYFARIRAEHEPRLKAAGFWEIPARLDAYLDAHYPWAAPAEG